MLALASFVFLVIRGTLVFVNEDVDFHPLVERVGGALVGLALGLFVIGFGCVCLLCMPFPDVLRNAKSNAEQATALVLLPCQTVARLLPGDRPLQLDRLLEAGGPDFSIYVKPPPRHLTSSRSRETVLLSKSYPIPETQTHLIVNAILGRVAESSH